MNAVADALRDYLTQVAKDDGDVWTVQERRDDMRKALAAHDAAVAAGGWSVRGVRVVLSPDGVVCLARNTTEAQRIVDCVNACEGIADPAGLVAALREIRALQAFAMTDGRGMRGDNAIELERIIENALGGEA